MIASYHNHTSWSDGKGSIETLVTHAATLGIAEVGISDHYMGRIKKEGPTVLLQLRTHTFPTWSHRSFGG